MRCGAILIGALALAGCAKPASSDADTQALASSTAQAAAAASSDVPDEASAATSASPVAVQTAAPAPEAPSTSRDPGKVVVAWAEAMTLKQWGLAYRYWGDQGARSGLTLLQFSEKWGKLANPEFRTAPRRYRRRGGFALLHRPDRADRRQTPFARRNRHAPGQRCRWRERGAAALAHRKPDGFALRLRRALVLG